MTNPSNSPSKGDASRSSITNNQLWQYLQTEPLQHPQVLSELMSDEAMEIVSNHIRGMLGALPSQQFDVQIATTREGLSRLLTGAMVTGYFLRDREQRLQLEQALSLTNGDEN